MAFSATKFSELPLPSHFLLYSSSKPSFRILRAFCSLRTTQTNNGNRNNRFSDRNRSPRPSRRGSGSSPSAPWLNKWPPRRAPTESPDRRVVEPERRGGERTERPKTAKDRGQNAIERIVLRLRNLGLGSDDEEEGDDLGLESDEVTGDEKLGDLLQREWIRPDFVLEDDKPVTALPWEREQDDEHGSGEGDPAESRQRRTKAPTMAELTIEDTELRRLRRAGMYLRDRISVPKAGLTQAVLDKIHDKWRKEELVRLKFHEVLAHDMKTAHEIVERRTGGLVLWRSGSVMVVYRGSNYDGPSNAQQLNKRTQDLFVPDVSSAVEKNPLMGESGDSGSHQAVRNPVTASEEEIEFNKLLDELGPRFHEYWGTGILPVDADLLPHKIPDYKTPYRVLPFGMRSRLTNGEMTNLRKLAKSIPCHFALGRNRNHQGLATAILKIWETSLVAKIAVKRGIQNTNNKLMAEELKNLTGGVLLLRNKYYIVIYRGKDFLPTTVAAALADRQKLTKKVQDVEEEVRIKDIDRRSDKVGVDAVPSKEDQGKALAGTLAEFYEAQARWGIKITSEDREKMLQEAAAAKHAKLVKRIEHKLSLAQAKKLRAEKLLSKIEASLVPAGPDYDQETITDEERVMFRRVGLKMKAYLPLGIRGVFDGVIENMHLHWKHRELVKLISKQKTLDFVEDSARLLEYESGGILVAIVKVPKGYALIYYRGKNYRRPFSLRPRNLLTKAKALKRSVAMQRHEALSQHISELEKTIDQMTNQVGASLKRHQDRQSRELEETSAFDNNDDEGSVMNSDDDFESEEDDEDSAMDSDDNDDDDDDDDDDSDSYSDEEMG